MEKYTTKYPQPRSPRLGQLLSSISPNHSPLSALLSPGLRSVMLARTPKREAIHRAAMDVFNFSGGSNDEDSSIQLLLDELPNVSSLAPILDISRNSLDSPLRASPGNAISPLVDLGSPGLKKANAITSPLAMSNENHAELASPDGSEEEQDKENREAELSRQEIPDLRDVDNVRAIIALEVDRLWRSIETSGKGELKAALKALQAERDEQTNDKEDKYSRDFRLFLRCWCNEILMDLLSSRCEKDVFHSRQGLRTVLERQILPRLCLLERKEVDDAHLALLRRAERTSHIQLDERRQLLVEMLYESEAAFLEELIQGDLSFEAELAVESEI